MVQYGPIWSTIIQMVQNGPKWSIIVQNLSKLVQNGPKGSNMVQYDPKLSLKKYPNGSGITKSPGLVLHNCVLTTLPVLKVDSREQS